MYLPRPTKHNIHQALLFWTRTVKVQYPKGAPHGALDTDPCTVSEEIGLIVFGTYAVDALIAE